MPETNVINTKIKKKDAHKYMDSWMECLPGELGNLFFQAGKLGPAERYDQAFSLGKDGIDELLKMATNPKSIRLYMGCHEVQDPNTGKLVDTFIPILKIPSKKSFKYFELKYNLPKEEDDRKVGTLGVITHGVAELFRERWLELEGNQLGEAFAGTTYEGLKKTKVNIVNVKEQYTGALKSRRVKSYEIIADDVGLMIRYLNSVEDTKRYFKLFMGAGLTIIVKHAFDFRPIIRIPAPLSVLSNRRTDMETDDVVAAVDFDRTKPCPPYCDPGE